MLKVKKISEKQACDKYGVRNITVYHCGKYEVRASLREGDEKPWTIYSVYVTKGTDYVPSIYHHNDLNGEKLGYFEIQTTSYGALGVEQYELFLKNCKHAYEVTKALNEYFCKED